jgi:hypothetical protein
MNSPPLPNSVPEVAPEICLPEEPFIVEEPKRKFQRNGNKEKPVKKAKASPAGVETMDTVGDVGLAAAAPQPGTQHSCTMPAPFSMDPETKVFGSGVPGGGAKARRWSFPPWNGER